ncbi:MAG: hypothetical protein PHI34_02975 [Acidobacteriota bacterium]|nr:hypothetical protein [Acidobacteriota bacterium]
MSKSIRRTVMIFSALAMTLILAGWAAAQVPAPANAQTKPEDMKKLYLEIAGDYVIDMEGQTQVLRMFEKDGALFGAPIDETPEVFNPIKDKPLFFEVTISSNGNSFEVQFVRNEKGVIFKCILNGQGMTIEAPKTIK